MLVFLREQSTRRCALRFFEGLVVCGLLFCGFLALFFRSLLGILNLFQEGVTKLGPRRKFVFASLRLDSEQSAKLFFGFGDFGFALLMRSLALGIFTSLIVFDLLPFLSEVVHLLLVQAATVFFCCLDRGFVLREQTSKMRNTFFDLRETLAARTEF